MLVPTGCGADSKQPEQSERGSRRCVEDVAPYNVWRKFMKQVDRVSAGAIFSHRHLISLRKARGARVILSGVPPRSQTSLRAV